MQKTILAAALAAGVGLAGTAVSAEEVNGVWLVESGNARVEVYDCDDNKCGKIVWLKEPNDENGVPKLDVNNEDEALRSRPIMGLVMLEGMVADGPTRWEDGTIYNGEDGKTYNSKMELSDGNLLVSGCVLFFCRDQTWTRVE